MKYLLHGHGGSGNHGCEAIVRTTLAMLPEGSDADVYSSDKFRDEQYGITNLAEFHQVNKKQQSPVLFTLTKGIFRVTGYPGFYNRFTFSEALKTKGAVCLAVGGDNYCNGEPGRHAQKNKMFSKHNKSVLWGASVTPELMNDPKCVEDMKRYDLITARESLTYNALVKAGVRNAKLVSDPAFTLPIEKTDLPDIFTEEKVVGINVSPLVMKYELGNNILMKNVEELIRYILNETKHSIALIPHVLLKGNDDRTPLRKLYDEFKDSGRIALIDDDDSLNCCQIKYVISKCAFMVAARTHASIAAYSTRVPTLVIGYSVKSQGIATDIFGTAENYVLPVDKIQKEKDLTGAFQWLTDHEDEIRKHYDGMMSDYIGKALLAKQFLMEL